MHRELDDAGNLQSNIQNHFDYYADLAKQPELLEIEKRLLEILDQERLDQACGIVRIAPRSFMPSEKDKLIQRRQQLFAQVNALVK